MMRRDDLGFSVSETIANTLQWVDGLLKDSISLGLLQLILDVVVFQWYGVFMSGKLNGTFSSLSRTGRR